MRVFVTGATGFIGTPTVKELLAAGHQVLGMARSAEGAASLAGIGADVHIGSLEDLESLRRGASASDAVIHLAFIHDWSHFAENCEIDRRAIEALGSALAGSGKSFLVTSGTGGLAGPGQVTTEDHMIPQDYPFPRVSEQTALSLKDVGASIMRLPQVHDPIKQGLITRMIEVYREKRVCAYIGDGRHGWPAAHVLDVARLYRLAIENAEPHARYHAIAEESVSMRAIAEAIGRRLQLPVKSIAPDEGENFFGWLALFAGRDMPASSKQTQKRLGWEPTGPGLIADLEHLHVSDT